MITFLLVEATERGGGLLNTYFYVGVKKAIKCYVKHAKTQNIYHPQPILLKRMRHILINNSNLQGYYLLLTFLYDEKITSSSFFT